MKYKNQGMAKRMEKAISDHGGSKGIETIDRAQLLLEINNLIVSNLNIPELLKTVSICLHRVVDHDFAVLFIYDEEAKALRAHALHSQLDDVAVEEGYLLPIENSVSGFTFTNKKTLIFDREDHAVRSLNYRLPNFITDHVRTRTTAFL